MNTPGMGYDGRGTNTHTEGKKERTGYGGYGCG